jgi:hypothetical protein
MTGLIVLVLILIGIPPTLGADVIMTLEATSGSLGAFVEVASGNVSGPGFVLDGFNRLGGFAEPLPVANLDPVLGN